MEEGGDDAAPVGHHEASGVADRATPEFGFDLCAAIYLVGEARTEIETQCFEPSQTRYGVRARSNRLGLEGRPVRTRPPTHLRANYAGHIFLDSDAVDDRYGPVALGYRHRTTIGNPVHRDEPGGATELE